MIIHTYRTNHYQQSAIGYLHAQDSKHMSDLGLYKVSMFIHTEV